MSKFGSCVRGSGIWHLIIGQQITYKCLVTLIGMHMSVFNGYTHVKPIYIYIQSITRMFIAICLYIKNSQPLVNFIHMSLTQTFYIAVTSYARPWRLKSREMYYSFNSFKFTDKENMKALHYCTFVGETIRHRFIPPLRARNAGNVSISWRHH